MKLILPLCLVLASCTSSHVMIGQARTPTDPMKVVLYNTPPSKFEEIALVNADNVGKAAWTQQGRLDAAIFRLKQRSAELGANGVILKNVSDGNGAVLVNGYSSNGFFNATAVPTGHLTKKVSGVAIWVP
jgi:hypothetical protein